MPISIVKVAVLMDVRPFEPLPEAGLAAEVEDLGVFLGLTPALVPGK